MMALVGSTPVVDRFPHRAFPSRDAEAVAPRFAATFVVVLTTAEWAELGVFQTRAKPFGRPLVLLGAPRREADACLLLGSRVVWA
jgi:hypothetical protein